MRPILFLDIDGVLVNARSLRERSGRHSVADSNCVAQLNRVTNVTGAALVLSSSWRFCGLEEIRLILQHWGVTGELISMTPDLTRKSGELGLYAGVPRGREIQEWLNDHAHDGCTFAIVDDDADMEHLTPRLVRCEFAAGLTDGDADRLIMMLAHKIGQQAAPNAADESLLREDPYLHDRFEVVR